MMRALARASFPAAAVALFAVCGSPPAARAAPPSSSTWRPGVNYQVISPAQLTTAPRGKVEVLQMFWLGCPHCYALEPYVRQWLKTKPDYIDFVRVPVTWDPLHRAHARLYYTLEALGRDDLAEKAFADLHAMETRTGTESVLFADSPQETLALQEAWAERYGISARTFAASYNSFYVHTELQRADDITQGYRVVGVPLFAVGGEYSTDVGMAGGDHKLFSLIDFLAAAVRRQQSAPP